MSNSTEEPVKAAFTTNESKELSIDDAVDVTIAPRLAEVNRCITKVLAPGTDTFEAVHDLRVSTRRAITSVEFFPGAIHKDFRQKTIQQLRDICRHAGHVRDLDVMIERIRTHCETESELLLETIQNERKVLFATLAVCLMDIRARMPSLDHGNQFVPRNDAPKPRSIGSFKLWAQHRVAKLAVRFQRLSKDTGRTARSLHRLRIHGKELRYAIEILTPVVPNIPSSTVYLRLQELQRLLGKINDSVVWCKKIKNYRDDSHAICLPRFVKSQSRKELRNQAEYFVQLEELWSEDEQSIFWNELRCLLRT